MANRARREVGGEEFDRLGGDLGLSFFGASAEVGRADDAGQAEERAVGAGFGGEDVERDAAEFAGFQTVGECGFVVDAAAGTIDEPHARLHFLNLRRADEAAGLIGQRRVDREVVDSRQHVGDFFDRLDAELLGTIARQERVEAEDFHLERASTLGDGNADTAEADDAERLAGDLRAHVLVAVPLAFEQALVGRGDVAREREHQRDRVLGGAERVAGRRVHHDDAPARGSGFVDVVGANAGTHDRLEPAIAFERFGRDLHAAAADRPVELRERLAERVAL